MMDFSEAHDDFSVRASLVKELLDKHFSREAYTTKESKEMQLSLTIVLKDLLKSLERYAHLQQKSLQEHGRKLTAAGIPHDIPDDSKGKADQDSIQSALAFPLEASLKPKKDSFPDAAIYLRDEEHELKEIPMGYANGSNKSGVVRSADLKSSAEKEVDDLRDHLSVEPTRTRD